MDIIQLIKQAADASGNPIAEEAAAILAKIVTPDLELKLKTEFVGWVKAKSNDQGSQVDDMFILVLSNLLGVPIPA